MQNDKKSGSLYTSFASWLHGVFLLVFGTQFRRRLAEMLPAESGQIIDRELVFLGKLRNRHLGHQDVPYQFFLFLLNQPLLG